MGRRMSLLYHPDKMNNHPPEVRDKAQGKFLEIKAAYDILQNEERRKIYDTFGVDLGEERPEVEVWSLGLQNVLQPAGFFVLKTLVMRLVIFLISFRIFGYFVLLVGVVIGVLYGVDFKYKEHRVRSEELRPFLQGGVLLVIVFVLCWIWEVLGEAVGLLYMASELVDVLAMAVDNWKLGVGAGVLSLFLSWLFRNWWWWIIGLEVFVVVIVLVSLLLTFGLMGIWIESVQKQHGDKLNSWRLEMRNDRKRLQVEIDDLKQKVESAGSQAAKAATKAKAR